MSTPCSEEGSIAAMGAVALLSFVAVLTLLYAHGSALVAWSNTREVADNAARIGAQQVDLSETLIGGELNLDPEAADSAVRDYVNLTESVTIDDVTITEDTVTVTVSQTVVGQLGVGTRTFKATKSATAIQGVDDEQ